MTILVVSFIIYIIGLSIGMFYVGKLYPKDESKLSFKDRQDRETTVQVILCWPVILIFAVVLSPAIIVYLIAKYFESLGKRSNRHD